MWGWCCHRRHTRWSDSGTSSTVHWSSWHLAWPPWPRTCWCYEDTRHLNSRATEFLLVVVALGSWGSAWTDLVALISKHSLVILRQLHFDRSSWVFFTSLRRLDIDWSTWVLVVISYSRVVAARLGSAVVHWKRKMLIRDEEDNLDMKNNHKKGLQSQVVPYHRRNGWSLFQSSRLYLGVRRRRTFWRWTRRTRGSPGWYPRRSQTCKNHLQLCATERGRIPSEHEKLLWIWGKYEKNMSENYSGFSLSLCSC